MKELLTDRSLRLQHPGMTAPRIATIGLLLSGCLTDPGDLGSLPQGSSGDVAGTSASESSSGSPQTSGSSTSGGLAESSGSSGELEDACDVGVGFPVRMGSVEFERAIEDLFGVVVDVSFVPSASPFDYSDTVAPEDTAQIGAAADTVAAAFVVPPCEGGMAACGEAFIAAWAPFVLRGQHDAAALQAAYDAETDHDAGVRAVVRAMIASPSFVEFSPTGEVSDGVLELDGIAVATRMSLLLWNSVPDAALLEAADALLTEEGIDAELPRMFADPRFARGQADLFAALTEIERLRDEDRSTVDASWSPTLAEAMIEEQRRFISRIASDEDGSLTDLYTSSSGAVTAELAALYGADLLTPEPAPGVWAPAVFDPTHRGGLLTQLGFVSLHSRDRPADAYQPPPVRGNGVLQVASCMELPPPPPSIPNDGDASNRTEWEAQVAPEGCQGCHVLLDGPGFVFANYDGLGRWSETDDSTVGGLLDEIQAEDAVDLSAQLAAYEPTIACTTRRYYEYGVRRFIDQEDDACALTQYLEAFEASDGNLRALVRAIAISASFRRARL